MTTLIDNLTPAEDFLDRHLEVIGYCRLLYRADLTKIEMAYCKAEMDNLNAFLRHMREITNIEAGGGRDDNDD